jgi:hypothetical protein
MTISYELGKGSHDTRETGMCAMEWVAYIAGEEHSDSPVCVDPVLRRFGMGLNDALPDDMRQRLRPYLARMIGTAGDGRSEERRWALADWAVRFAAAEAQDVTGRKDLGDKLRALPEVTAETKDEAIEVARAVRDGRRAANAYAAAAANAAANAADAAAAAAYAAAAYANAAADAADAAAARRHMWERLLPSALDLLDRLLPTEHIEIPDAFQADYDRLMEGATA